MDDQLIVFHFKNIGTPATDASAPTTGTSSPAKIATATGDGKDDNAAATATAAVAATVSNFNTVKIKIGCVDQKNNITALVQEKIQVVELLQSQFNVTATLEGVEQKDDYFAVTLASLDDCAAVLNKNAKSPATLSAQPVRIELILNTLLLIARPRMNLSSLSNLLSAKLNVTNPEIIFVSENIGLVMNVNSNSTACLTLDSLNDIALQNKILSLTPFSRNSALFHARSKLLGAEEAVRFVESQLDRSAMDVFDVKDLPADFMAEFPGSKAGFIEKFGVSEINLDTARKEIVIVGKEAAVQQMKGWLTDMVAECCTKLVVGRDAAKYLTTNGSALTELEREYKEIRTSIVEDTVLLIGERNKEASNRLKRVLSNLTMNSYTVSSYLPKPIQDFLSDKLCLYRSVVIFIPTDQPVSKDMQVNLWALYPAKDNKWNEISAIMKKLVSVERVWPTNPATSPKSVPAFNPVQIDQFKAYYCLYALKYDISAKTYTLIGKSEDDIEHAIAALIDSSATMKNPPTRIDFHSKFTTQTTIKYIKAAGVNELNKILKLIPDIRVRLPELDEKSILIYGKARNTEKAGDAITKFVKNLSFKEFIVQISEFALSELQRDALAKKLFDELNVVITDIKLSKNEILLSGRVNGVLVEVVKGSLLDEPTDVIVNAANESLAHGGGLAGVISRAAGRDFDSESRDYVQLNGRVTTGTAALTSAGKLPFKGVIHAVAPIWSPKTNREDLIYSAISGSLRIVTAKRFKSISIPAIGSGIYGIPKDISANNVVKAVADYLKETKNHGIQNVRLCDVEVRALTAMHNALKETLKKESSNTPITPVQLDDDEMVNVKITITQAQNEDRIVQQLQEFITNNITK